MPSKKTQAKQPSPIGTRASNKLAHPGHVTKTGASRRTSAEVQQERDAKAKAKTDREEAKKLSIIRAAEFERAEMANEETVDATPRPPFTPKSWPRNKKKASKLVKSSDVEMGPPDASSLSPIESVTEDESVAKDDSLTESESDVPIPPAKKQKFQATSTVGGSGKVTHSERKVGKDKKIVVTTEEEQTSTPKKVKAKVRDEINFAAKKMENEDKEDKYHDMVSPCLVTIYMPAPKAPSQVQAARQGGGKQGGKKLKREGAIADINALDKKVTTCHWLPE